ncbi:hypothetical protein TNCV_2576751 [Trichonephila clavipes]|nr:hypothetical protein TNCV_2576751 [Trichonephila clavipes]
MCTDELRFQLHHAVDKVRENGENRTKAGTPPALQELFNLLERRIKRPHPYFPVGGKERALPTLFFKYRIDSTYLVKNPQKAIKETIKSVEALCEVDDVL